MTLASVFCVRCGRTSQAGVQPVLTESPHEATKDKHEDM